MAGLRDSGSLIGQFGRPSLRVKIYGISFTIDISTTSSLTHEMRFGGSCSSCLHLFPVMRLLIRNYIRITSGDILLNQCIIIKKQ